MYCLIGNEAQKARFIQSDDEDEPEGGGGGVIVLSDTKTLKSN